jgi:hypothetical protein
MYPDLDRAVFTLVDETAETTPEDVRSVQRVLQVARILPDTVTFVGRWSQMPRIWALCRSLWTLGAPEIKCVGCPWWHDLLYQIVDLCVFFPLALIDPHERWVAGRV